MSPKSAVASPTAGFYRHFGKRLLDILLSILATVVLFPFFLIIAVAIRLETPGPIFYVQDRLGLHGKIFPAIKFRTMTTPSGYRITKYFRTIRT